MASLVLLIAILGHLFSAIDAADPPGKFRFLSVLSLIFIIPKHLFQVIVLSRRPVVSNEPREWHDEAPY